MAGWCMLQSRSARDLSDGSEIAVPGARIYHVRALIASLGAASGGALLGALPCLREKQIQVIPRRMAKEAVSITSFRTCVPSLLFMGVGACKPH